VHEYAGMLLDGAPSEWIPKAIFGGFIAMCIWLLQRAVSANDARQSDDRAEVRKQGDKLNAHDIHLARHDERLDNMDKAARHQRSED
jgi:hypothetical protein